MSELVRITLLGSLYVQQGERVIRRFKYQKVGALLAYLAYHLRQPHSREVLVEIFWPDGTPEAGRSSLSVALSSLRHQLEPPGTPAHAVLRADRYSVALNPAAVSTDVAELEQALRDSRRTADPVERLRALERAAELYQGPLLPGYYEDWIQPEQNRLAEGYFDAIAALIGLLEQQGDIAAALRYAHQAVSLDRLREEAHEHLIRLLLASGRPGAALRQYRALEQALQDELGVPPRASLRALAREIEAAGIEDRSAAPPAPSISLPPDVPDASSQPTTMTLMMSDVEGVGSASAGGAASYQDAMDAYLAAMRREVARCGGQHIREGSGSFLVAFRSAGRALTCAVAVQRELAVHPAPTDDDRLRVRMALHTGDVEMTGSDYLGPALQQVSRLLTAGHAPQILCSEVTGGLVGGEPGGNARLVDLGVWRLADTSRPQRIFEVDYPDRPHHALPRLRAAPADGGRIPARLTRFFGRQGEITALTDLILSGETRLVTLTGPGGTGKTRLAMETADMLPERYGGEVWFVPLADVSGADRVADAIVDAMRVPRSAGMEAIEQVTVALARQPALLILDNLEHLIGGGAADGTRIVQELLERTRTLRIVVTSRRLLRISGEREFAVRPLSTPGGSHDATPERLTMYDSVRLFVDRAQEAMPHFQVTVQNAPAIARLCDRLEGIPLAVELAAARAGVLGSAQMLAQLDKRFGFLVSRKRDVSERHRTLETAIDWSYRLLAPELQRFFARLSVFRGGWTADAAEAVCEEPLSLDYLAELRDGSLIFVDEETMCFRMLETIREFAEERLTPAERSAARHRFAEYFSRVPYDDGPGQNHMAALEYARSHDNPMAAVRLGAILYWQWWWRGRMAEGRQVLSELIALPEASESSPERAGLLHSLGALALAQGDGREARQALDEALAIRRQTTDKAGIADTLDFLSMAYLRAGEYAAADAAAAEAFALFGEALLEPMLDGVVCPSAQREAWLKARAEGVLHGIARIALARGDFPAARNGFAAYPAGAIGQLWVGLIDVAEGHLESGYEIAERCACEKWNDQRRAECLHVMGLAACGLGVADVASLYFQEALRLCRDLRLRCHIGEDLVALAQVAHSVGDAARSVRLFACAAALLDECGARLFAWRQEEVDRALDALKGALGEAAFADAWANGRAMDREQGIAYALESGSVG